MKKKLKFHHQNNHIKCINWINIYKVSWDLSFNVLPFLFLGKKLGLKFVEF